EMAEMMEAMFADTHSEAIRIDDVIYMQFTGGMFAVMAEDFGEDAWFTLDLAEDTRMGDIYRQFGSFDLSEQTQMMLTDLSDVEETEEGVYTGTLDPESEAMRTMLQATGGAANGVEIPEGIEITVTVDDDGLLTTLEMTLPESEGMVVHMVSEVTDIGGDYAITAPQSDNMHSFDEFAGAMQRSRGPAAAARPGPVAATPPGLGASATPRGGPGRRRHHRGHGPEQGRAGKRGDRAHQRHHGTKGSGPGARAPRAGHGHAACACTWPRLVSM